MKTKENNGIKGYFKKETQVINTYYILYYNDIICYYIRLILYIISSLKINFELSAYDTY